VCKFFTNTGRCALGDRCSRTHDANADSQARRAPACVHSMRARMRAVSSHDRPTAFILFFAFF
jgi:hypothetical protein